MYRQILLLLSVTPVALSLCGCNPDTQADRAAINTDRSAIAKCTEAYQSGPRTGQTLLQETKCTDAAFLAMVTVAAPVTADIFAVESVKNESALTRYVNGDITRNELGAQVNANEAEASTALAGRGMQLALAASSQ